MNVTAFTKMHGLGNDFVVLDARVHALNLSQYAARLIADRRIGIGCDQIIVIGKLDSHHADFSLRFFNPDGGEAGACGNGTRCAAHFLFRQIDIAELRFSVGNRILPTTQNRDGSISVDMGEPGLGWNDIPLAREMDTLCVLLEVPGFARDAVCMGMGNPHATLFVPDLGSTDIASVGPLLERHPVFPERANIGFAQVIDRERIRLRVWERGAGLTLACGSGACAAAVAAAQLDLTGRRVTVDLELGSLEIEWKADNHVHMTGPAAFVGAGTFSPEFLALL